MVTQERTASAAAPTKTPTSVIPDTVRHSWNFPLAAAHDYAALGIAVHPLCGPKHTCGSGAGKIPWDIFEGKHLVGWQSHGVPTDAEIGQWLSHVVSRRANIGCLTGKPSNLVAVDVDGEGGERLLTEMSGGNVPATWEYRTGGGRRLIFAYDARVRTNRDLQGNHQGLEILSDGAQMVLPPSVHPSGRVYEWAPGRDPWSFGPPAPAPKWLYQTEDKSAYESKDKRLNELREIAEGVTHGQRNNAAAKLTGYLLHYIDPIVAESLVKAWDLTNNPPLGTELDKVIESIARAELRRRRAQ